MIAIVRFTVRVRLPMSMGSFGGAMLARGLAALAHADVNVR
jgi:hypothetical protein